MLDASELVQSAHVHNVEAVTFEESAQSFVELIDVRREDGHAGDA